VEGEVADDAGRSVEIDEQPPRGDACEDRRDLRAIRVKNLSRRASSG